MKIRVNTLHLFYKLIINIFICGENHNLLSVPALLSYISVIYITVSSHGCNLMKPINFREINI